MCIKYYINVDNVLFFGCRYKEKDFHFKDEWEEYSNENKLKVFTAFSRDQVNNNYNYDNI